jgi:hypothetical protein
MFGSVFGVIVGSIGQNNQEDSSLEYEGYEFVSQDGLWYTVAGNFQFAFTYFPSQVQNNTETLNPLTSYSGKPLYVSSEDSNSEIEIYRNLQQIAERIQSACLDENNCEEDFPIKTCSDNFIIIEESSESGITQSNNCVYIRGNQEELLELTNEFLFKIIGIK